MSIVDSIRKIAEAEIRKLHTTEIGKVTSVFPHSTEGDKDNYECNVKLRDKDVELRKVPVIISQIGLANIPHVGDLVLLTFVNGDINSPVILGRLYNDEDRPPLSKMEEIVYAPPYTKDEKLRRINIVLPESTLNLNFYDDRISLTVGKSSVNVNSEGEIIMKSMEGDQSSDGGNAKSAITVSTGGIEISSDSDILIKTKSNIQLECGADFSVEAKGDISLTAGKDVIIKSTKDTQVQATTSLSLKSSAVANVESTGPMTIKGAIVNIN
ncbi:MAG TPA: phage baseplate assembly protein V [Nitrososphaeraceae archaeon]|jgi:hypothetical protein